MLTQLISKLFGINRSKNKSKKFQTLSSEEFKRMTKQKDAIILDVRTSTEYKQGHISGAENVDVFSRKFLKNLKSHPKTHSYLIYCRSGNRSIEACKTLSANGYKKVYCLDGGILNWKGDLVK
ncbi:MAG: rhodanese-like domain-containing protein [Cytophagales bacterium]